MESNMASHQQFTLGSDMDLNQGSSLGSVGESQLDPSLQPNPEINQEPTAECNANPVADQEAQPKKKTSTGSKGSKKEGPKIRKPHQKEETIKLMKYKVQGTIEFLQAKGIHHTKQDVFEFFGIARTRGYEMLGNRDRRKRKPGDPETRGRPTKLSKESVNRMDEILQAWGLEGRAMTWKGLAAEAEVPDVSWRTIQRTMQKRGYRKCKACNKTYAAPDMADVSQNPVMSHSNAYMLEDETVRYAENLQFAMDPQRTLNFMPKPGEHHCGNCNQQQDQSSAPMQSLPLS